MDQSSNFDIDDSKPTIYHLPLQLCKVQAGFPSFADDSIEENIDLNKYLIRHPAATFFVRVSGDSMIKAGIHDNDLLIVDRSLAPNSGRVVIAAVEGYLTVKRLIIKDGKAYLHAENDAFLPITLTSDTGTHIWGVVTNVIHAL